MAAVTDFSKPPQALMVDLIKDANPAMAFVVADVAFDNPADSQGEDALHRNTRVVVRSTASGKFAGLKDVIYDRVDIGEVISYDPEAFVENTQHGTLRDLLPVINERFGINLTRADIVDQVLANVYGTITVPLTASNESLVYKGSTTITIQRSISLVAAVADRFLDGITFESDTPDTTAADKLIERLNVEELTSPYVFGTDNISFGMPATSIGTGFDTRVTITALPNSGFLDSVDVFYRRINLGDIITLETVGLTSYSPFTPESLLFAINIQLGTFLRLTDVQPISIATPEPGVPYNVTIVAAGDSLGFRGTADLQVAIGIPDSYENLNTIINVDWPAAV